MNGAADDAQHFEFQERLLRHEDALSVRRRVGGSDGDAVGAHQQQIVLDHAFEDLAVAKSQPDPEPVQLRTLSEDALFAFAWGAFELLHEVHGSYLGVRYEGDLSAAPQDFNAVGALISLRGDVSLDVGPIHSAQVGLLCC